jgi:hypothetical protein
MGCHGSQISHLLRFLELPLRVQKALHRGKIKVSEAMALHGPAINIVDAAMDLIEAGKSHKEIFAELKQSKREARKNASGGKKTVARSLAEFKAELEVISAAADSPIELSNRAGKLLDYLAGNESEPLSVTLGGAA